MSAQALIVVFDLQRALPFSACEDFNGVIARALRITIERRVGVIFADEMSGKNQLHFGYIFRFGPAQLQPLRQFLRRVGNPQVRGAMWAGNARQHLISGK